MGIKLKNKYFFTQDNYKSFVTSAVLEESKYAYFNNRERSMYSNVQIGAFANDLELNLYGNPHSESKSSELSNNLIRILRKNILAYFNTTLSKYTVVFTHSNRQNMKLVMESFPFNSTTTLYIDERSSLDISGLKTFAEEKNSKIEMYNKIIPKHLTNSSVFVTELVNESTGEVKSKQEINDLLSVRDDNTFVFADASLYLNANEINLGEMQFDALGFSFDRIVGYPSLGVLLLSTRMISLLEKPYFGGGTLVYALTQQPFEKLRMRPSERFEDGSLPFLTLSAANFSTNIIRKFGSERSKYIINLGNILEDKLSKLKNVNLYNEGERNRFIFSFTVKDRNGTELDTKNVINAARKSKIILGETLIGNKSYVTVSLGWLSTTNDIDILCSFLKFLDK